MNDKEYIISNLDGIHTTPMGVKRIAHNLALRDNGEDVLSYIRAVICSELTVFYRKGKNIYVEGEGCRITVNASSLSVITAHRL
ncbi:MAG: DUF3781 domain-containing protein [Paramuribaculum sp.]|nr:DUF3781 domain-containing protein [Paramuribaculum sp.]